MSNLRSVRSVQSAPVLTLALLVLGAVPAAAVPITTLFSTGVDASGALLGDYAVDPHYTLTTSPGFPVAGAITVGIPDLPVAWAANTATSRWINPDGVGGFMADWHPGGVYEYETSFDLTGLDPSTVMISLAWAADDASVPFTDFIRINGIALPPGGAGSGTGPDPGSYSGLHLKLLDATATPFFLPGINTLTFVVGNADTVGDPTLAPYSGPTGMQVTILGSDAAIIPEPGTGPMAAAALVALSVWARRRRS
jgi:hypothetical protein